MYPKTEATILCGGRGERLRPLTDHFQKVIIPIGPKKLPLLDYVIRLVARHGITKITLLTGYRSRDIRSYFGNSSRHNVNLTYSEDSKNRRGSLNAVANALRKGAISKCDELLVYYGDVLSDLDIKSLISTHRRTGANATLALARGYTLSVGIAEVGKDGIVTSCEEPELDLSVMIGCMVIGPRL